MSHPGVSCRDDERGRTSCPPPGEVGNSFGPVGMPASLPPFWRKPETTSAPNPQGRGPRLSPPHPSFRRKPETTSAPYQWTVVSRQWLAPTPQGRGPRLSPPHPSFRRKPETTSAPTPQGRGPRLSPPHPSFRRKPETTSALNPQGRGPRLSPGRRRRAAGQPLR